MKPAGGFIEVAVQLIEALAVAVILFFILAGSVQALVRLLRRTGGAYDNYRLLVGRTLLVGLELLVAADIIRTVALDLTLLNIGALAALVLVRTFLSWTLILEVEGHWPWRKEGKSPGIAPGGEGR